MADKSQDNAGTVASTLSIVFRHESLSAPARKKLAESSALTGINLLHSVFGYYLPRRQLEGHFRSHICELFTNCKTGN